MKSYEPLQKAFNKLDQSTVEWHRTARFPKTMETANSILYRNAVVDASTLAYMCHCLGLTNRQTVDVLEGYAKEVPKKAAEVAVLRKLIAPAEITKDDQTLIESLRGMDDTKRKLIFDMVRSLS